MPERPPCQLEHLTGVRFFLALWIVCGHYMPSSPNDKGFGITCRSFAAVNFFVVMSGFVTHLAYGQRLASGMKLKTFYLRRMSQIVITTYVAMIASLLVVVVIPEYRNSFMPSFATILGCFAFIMHWIRPATWCPAPPSWTVEALIPCWLLYPLLRRLVETLDKVGGMALMSSMLLLYGVSFGPLLSLYFLWPGGNHLDFCKSSFFLLTRRLVLWKEILSKWYCNLFYRNEHSNAPITVLNLRLMKVCLLLWRFEMNWLDMTRDPSCFLPVPQCLAFTIFVVFHLCTSRSHETWGMLHVSLSLKQNNILLLDLHFLLRIIKTSFQQDPQ